MTERISEVTSDISLPYIDLDGGKKHCVTAGHLLSKAAKVSRMIDSDMQDSLCQAKV